MLPAGNVGSRGGNTTSRECVVGAGRAASEPARNRDVAGFSSPPGGTQIAPVHHMRPSAIAAVAVALLAANGCDGDPHRVASDAAPDNPDASAGVPDAADLADAAADDAGIADAAVVDAAEPLADAAPPMVDAAIPVADARPPMPDASVPRPDASVPRPDASTGIPPGVDGRITINEFMTLNAVTVRDDTGVTSDWMELYNPTNQDIPLGGYGVSDNLANPRRGVLPAGVVIRAGGYLLLWFDDSPEKGPTHLDFELKREFGDLVLVRPDGSPIDRIQYGAQAVDFSAAREPSGSSYWKIEWHPTPGAANPSGPGTPIGLEVATAPPEQVPAAGDLSERILGYDTIPSLTITLSSSAITALEADPFTDVPGQLVFDGRSYGPVGVRLKGANSFQPISRKPSFRINIDEYVARAKFFGLKDLTLDNMDDDWSMMHERLAYLVMRRAGVPASRCNHLLLTVNSTFYGLYANVETVKRIMLQRWFASWGGPLFEGTNVDFLASYIDDYERESGPDDRSLLSGVASALTMPSADEAISAAGAYARMSEFRRYWAVASVIGQFDAWPYGSPGNDYFVYGDPADDRLWFMPWGMDETFSSSDYDVKQVGSVLAQTCLDSASCFDDYVQQTWEILAMTEAFDLDRERERVADQIAPYVQMDTRKPYSNTTVANAQQDMHFFISERRAHLATMLPP
jgi:hypothetical protein